jgi:hypothetical protein
MDQDKKERPVVQKVFVAEIRVAAARRCELKEM